MQEGTIEDYYRQFENLSRFERIQAQIKPKDQKISGIVKHVYEHARATEIMMATNETSTDTLNLRIEHKEGDHEEYQRFDKIREEKGRILVGFCGADRKIAYLKTNDQLEFLLHAHEKN